MTCRKRDIDLIDDSGTMISLTLWGDHATNFKSSIGDIIVIKRAKLTIYQGITRLSTTNSSSIFYVYEGKEKNNTDELRENIVNLTDIEIPHKVAKVLNLVDRYNHALNPTKKDVQNILKNVEDTINPFSPIQEKQFDEREMDIIRNKILNCIYRYDPKKLYISEHERELELDLRNTQRFMKENSHIFITKSDQGNKVVLMYKESYLDRMRENLSDGTQYEKVQRN
ncbi:hypothetical protein QAD02_017278 [Eretmocerus hayati]|uniref:Uncharacterized protein n=1 Tax=Eretmocerus hayati TaxID=131215 RepID=A0ACC2PF91_9HYME|nr:hypothetical protein QAD02_017278 [Eretmocerus hayati]